MGMILRRGALALGIVTLACSSGDITSSLTDTTKTTPPDTTPATVVVTPPTSTTIVVGTSISLTTAVKNATGTVLPTGITWSTSDANTLTVSSTGVVTGVNV